MQVGLSRGGLAITEARATWKMTEVDDSLRDARLWGGGIIKMDLLSPASSLTCMLKLINYLVPSTELWEWRERNRGCLVAANASSHSRLALHLRGRYT